MKKILFNDTAIIEDRQKVTSLSLDEENRVIEILSDALNFHTKEEKEAVQKLVYHYENLCHFAAINSNKWLEYCN